jgi:hypothetical protein
MKKGQKYKRKLGAKMLLDSKRNKRGNVKEWKQNSEKGKNEKN